MSRRQQLFTPKQQTLEPVPKLVGALKVAHALQVGIHKLTLHRNNLDGGGLRTADLNLAPPESPK
jgi:hypothetical protein